MAGLLIVATLVYWTLGSGQRQWWAVYVEMPAPAGAEDVRPAAATPAADAGTAASDDNRDANDQPAATTDTNHVTKLDAAQESFAGFFRQLQTQQQQQQEQEQQQQQEQQQKETII